MKRKPQGTTTYPKRARVLSNNVFALRSLRREAIQSWCGGAGDEGGGSYQPVNSVETGDAARVNQSRT